jgi:NAD+ diphosphatase
VEPGESLEDAVAREVMEETAVEVTSVRYDSSQPWPFPSSLMLGFHATAAAGSPVKVGHELEAAAWFSREQIQSGAALVPPSHAISYRLISAWLEGRV